MVGCLLRARRFGVQILGSGLSVWSLQVFPAHLWVFSHSGFLPQSEDIVDRWINLNSQNWLKVWVLNGCASLRSPSDRLVTYSRVSPASHPLTAGPAGPGERSVDKAGSERELMDGRYKQCKINFNRFNRNSVEIVYNKVINVITGRIPIPFSPKFALQVEGHEGSVMLMKFISILKSIF